MLFSAQSGVTSQCSVHAMPRRSSRKDGGVSIFYPPANWLHVLSLSYKGCYYKVDCKITNNRNVKFLC